MCLCGSVAEVVSEIRWLFPVCGVPEVQPVSDSLCTTVRCPARGITEQRLQVLLAGVVACPSSKQLPLHDRRLSEYGVGVRDRALGSDRRKSFNGVVVGESNHSFLFTFDRCMCH